MNIAFPAFVLLVLLLPGVIFRKAAIERGPFRDRRPVADEIATSLVIAITLQVAWFVFIGSVSRLLFDARIDLRSLMMLLLGQFGPADGGFDGALASVTQYPIHVFGYFASLCITAKLLGLAWRRRLKPAFREVLQWADEVLWGRESPAPLDYLFEDEFDHADDESINRSFYQWVRTLSVPDEFADGLAVALVAAIVEVGGQPYLYKGFAQRILFNADGELDRILLIGAERRLLHHEETHGEQIGSSPTDLESESAEDTAGSRYYRIPGDTFILRLSETKTLNFAFVAITEDEDENPESTD